MTPIFVVRSGGQISKHYFAGSQRIATKFKQVDENNYETQQYYYHPDHLGSSSFITDTQGALYEHLEYFPFGETWLHEQTNANTMVYKFTGKEYDEVTGLYYYGARYYDPRTSVWQSPDPILEQYMGGKPNGGVFNPKNLNMFGYTYNNPVNLSDQEGEFVTQAAGAFFGAAISLGSQIATQMATNGGDFSKVDIDWVDVGSMAAVGAVTSGLGLTAGKARSGAKKANDARKKYNSMSAKISQKPNINQKQMTKMERFQQKASEAKSDLKKIAATQAGIAASKEVIKESINDSDVNKAVDAVIDVVKTPDTSSNTAPKNEK